MQHHCHIIHTDEDVTVLNLRGEILPLTLPDKLFHVSCLPVNNPTGFPTLEMSVVSMATVSEKI